MESSKEYGDFLDKIEEKHELEKVNNLPEIVAPHVYLSNVVPNRPNYDNYMFRPHAFFHLTGGIPKPPTESQIETYKAYEQRFKDFGVLAEGEKGTRGKELSQKQVESFHKIGSKINAEISLSSTACSYLDELVQQDRLGFSNSISTMQMRKGIIRENDSIKLLSEFLGYELVKNTERLDNGFWNGEWDLNDLRAEATRDIKTSWTKESHSNKVSTQMESSHFWQGQGYLDLTGMNYFIVNHCLIDSLNDHVDREVYKLIQNPFYTDDNWNLNEIAIPAIVELVTNHFVTIDALKSFCEQSSTVKLSWFENFYEPPIDARIIEKVVERDEKAISQMKELVILARDYMNNKIK